MADTLLVILAVLVLVCSSIAQAYRSVPLYELKRRARQGDATAKRFYQVASYKFSSQFFLWALAAVASVLFFELIARHSPYWVALTGCIVVLWFGFIWIPRSSLNYFSEYLAKILSGPIHWTLLYIDRPINFVRRILRVKTKESHTGLYEISDLVELLTRQQSQPDNRINKVEIDLLKRVLYFNDEKVIEVMIPKRRVVSVNVSDTLGPIVLDELYKSNQVFFPVYRDKSTNIVGMIDITHTRDTRDNTVAERLMSKTVCYVHEEEYLSDLLRAIVKTHQHMFVVVNNKGDYTGVVSAKTVLDKLIGDDIADEFNHYEDRELVAQRFSFIENSKEQISKDSTEVLE